MIIGNIEIKKRKSFVPRVYLLAYTVERNDNKTLSSFNYVLNKTTALMERKKIMDVSFLSKENIFTSFDEIQKFIDENIMKVKSLGKFLESGSVHEIAYVEEMIVEKEDHYEIEVNSTQLIWNKRDKKLVPIS